MNLLKTNATMVFPMTDNLRQNSKGEKWIHKKIARYLQVKLRYFN